MGSGSTSSVQCKKMNTAEFALADAATAVGADEALAALIYF